MKKEKITLLGEQYKIEKKWAKLIKASKNKQERNLFIKNGYNELRKFYSENNLKGENSSFGSSKMEDMLILKIIGKDKTVLEIGFGSGNSIRNLAQFQKKIIGIEKSDFCLKTVSSKLSNFRNVELKIGDFLDEKFTNDYFDAIYCIQVIEHLLPEEISFYFGKIYNLLKKNAVLIITTCNRLTGPYDISRYFSDIAQGFHFKEYTYVELTELLKIAKFGKIYSILDLPKKLYEFFPIRQNFPFLKIPVALKCLLEILFSKISIKSLRRLCFKLFRLNGIFLIAYK